MTPTVRRLLACLAVLLICPPTIGVLFAQSYGPSDLPLGQQPHGHLHALLERTIFQLDVLSLDLCFDSTTAAAIGSAVEEPAGDDDARDEVARLAMGAHRALGVIEFRRDVSLDQFLDGIAEDHDRAVRVGLLADSTRNALRTDLREWYGFLETRGIRDGDRIAYRFAPDRVRTTYLGVEGQTHLDRIARGSQRRASVLGAYFAPGASLREGLIDSVMKVREPRDGPARCSALSAAWETGSP